jgi:hypothetical protein
MNKNKRVLIVTNAITAEEVSQIKNAFESEFASPSPIEISIVHVIPQLPTCYFNIPSMGVLVEKYYDEAKQSLNHVGRNLSIPKKNQWLISGKIRTEVLRLANKLGSNFILASAKQIQELQRSLFFNNIHEYAKIKTISHIEQL